MNLSRSERDVMHFLSTVISEAVTVREIYEMKGGERTYIYKILDKLLDLGLVYHCIGVGNKSRFYLTPYGEAAYLSMKF